MNSLPTLPLSAWIDSVLNFLTSNYSGVTRSISRFTQTGIDTLNDLLMAIPEWALIAIFALACWRASSWRLALGAVLGLGLIWNLDPWIPTIQTLTLVVIATVIFSMPPAIRLTILGIRQVPDDLIEAADAYGATRAQKLFKVQLPLSLPTIMAGVNQTIMLALSMVVIAAMIGADGLGSEVWRAIQRLRPGDGFVAGLAVVILAMLLDRLTQSFQKKEAKKDN